MNDEYDSDQLDADEEELVQTEEAERVPEDQDTVSEQLRSQRNISESVLHKRRHDGRPNPMEPPRKKRGVDIATRSWFITWNNYTTTSINTLLGITGLERYQIQEEICPSTGTPHLQGVLYFSPGAKKWSTLDNTCHHKCIWKPCRNLFAARNYCSKERTKAPGGKSWTKNFQTEFHVTDPLAGKKMYAWQEAVVRIIEGTISQRIIYWFWSNKGNIGKSALVKHLVLKHGAIISGGKCKDAYYAIAEMVKKKLNPYIVVFDIPRAAKNDITYEGIEGIKNGLFFSPKYESSQCAFNAPHIIVMSNMEPQYGEMSRDRWVVRCLDGEEDLKHIPGEYDFSVNRN